jgi:hypothetical protein
VGLFHSLQKNSKEHDFPVLLYKLEEWYQDYKRKYICQENLLFKPYKKTTKGKTLSNWNTFLLPMINGLKNARDIWVGEIIKKTPPLDFLAMLMGKENIPVLGGYDCTLYFQALAATRIYQKWMNHKKL